jgi:hypothetical protein
LKPETGCRNVEAMIYNALVASLPRYDDRVREALGAHGIQETFYLTSPHRDEAPANRLRLTMVADSEPCVTDLVRRALRGLVEPNDIEFGPVRPGGYAPGNPRRPAAS